MVQRTLLPQSLLLKNLAFLRYVKKNNQSKSRGTFGLQIVIYRNGRIVARYWVIAKGVFFPSEPRVTSYALGSGQIPQRQEFRLVIAKPALQLVDEEEVCKSPEARRRTICTLATALFLGTAYAGQIEGIKEAENVPTAFSQLHVLALLVAFLFLNRYIESGSLAPHSAVERIVRRILRWKK